MRISEAGYGSIRAYTAKPFPVVTVAAASPARADVAHGIPDFGLMGLKIAGALGAEGTWAIMPMSSDPRELLDGCVSGLFESAPGTAPKVVGLVYDLCKLGWKMNQCAGEEDANRVLLDCSPEFAEAFSMGLKLFGHENLAAVASIASIVLEAVNERPVAGGGRMTVPTQYYPLNSVLNVGLKSHNRKPGPRLESGVPGVKLDQLRCRFMGCLGPRGT